MAAQPFFSPPGLTVTKRAGSERGLLLQHGSYAAPGLPGTPNPRPANGSPCPVRPGMADQDQGSGISRLVFR